MADHECVTLVPCLDCHGQFKRLEEFVDPDLTPVASHASKQWRMGRCSWCSDGAMTPDQVKAWIQHRRLKNPPVPRED